MTFRKKLRQGTFPIGTLLTLPAPELVEIAAAVGYDWVFIDREHGTIAYQDALRMVQAAPGGFSTLVRIPSATEEHVKQTLDAGCDGIIVPQVNSPELASQLVQWAKYPPLGMRGVGAGRAHQYGLSFEAYINTANESTSLIIQVEHIRATQSINDILAVEGIDGILIGPYDLSSSMGKMGRLQDPEVVEALQRVKEAANRQNVPWGIFTQQPETVSREKQDGASFIAVGTDTGALITRLQEVLRQSK
jgi:2-keto-3-deoxy-L-rhamnonate aldolase RhmA